MGCVMEAPGGNICEITPKRDRPSRLGSACHRARVSFAACGDDCVRDKGERLAADARLHLSHTEAPWGQAVRRNMKISARIDAKLKAL